MAVFLVGIAVALWLYFKPTPIPPGITVEGTTAQEMAKVGTEAIQTAPVKAYKAQSKAKLSLPTSVQNNAAAHVLTSVQTANDEHRHTLTTVLDTVTGIPITYDRVDSSPWLAVNTKTAIGAYYGYKRGGPAIRIEARQEFLQIKDVHVAVIGSIDQQAGQSLDGFIGIGVVGRW